MKLIIQIPCFNEEETLPLVFEKMPRKIQGIDEIEFQIIDDGSTDKTIEVAKKLGVKHIVTYKGRNRRWLGRAFKLGLDNALKNGADILVNTDGDNQYPSEKIPELIKPLLEGKAEIAIGDRRTSTISEFTPIKKFLQKLGTRTTQMAAGDEVRDAVSGFRAYTRTAMLKINIVTEYTYTVDTVIQASRKGLDIAWIPIKVNPKTRESRLIKSIFTKVKKSGMNIIRMFMIYEPFKTFLTISSFFFIIAFFFVGRFVFNYLTDNGAGNVQSVVIGASSFVAGVQIFSLGIIAELIGVNRKLVEDNLERTKEIQYSKSK